MVHVVRSVALPVNDPLTRDSLPPDFRFLICSETQTVIEPALLWLSANFSPNRGRWHKTSVSNAAYALCDWWRFLDRQHKEWTDVSESDLDSYRDESMALISPRTHEHLCVETIRQRMLTVIAFYRWALAEGHFSGPALGQVEPHRRFERLDSDALSHIGTRSDNSAYRALPRSNASPDDHVHPLAMTNWRKIAQELGPLPSENDLRPSRDRLAAEMALFAGPRVEEISYLILPQILSLPINDAKPDSVVAIRLTKTKGDRPRNILVPVHLVLELIRYIDTERQDCLAAGRRYGLRNSPQALFLNGVDARHNAGKPASSKTLSLGFHNAVVRAGFISKLLKQDPASGDKYFAPSADHTFHDLRHTFACLLYEAEVRRGNPEPWKVVQGRLGHKNLQTTLDTYLRVVDIFRADVHANVYRFIRMTLGGSASHSYLIR